MSFACFLVAVGQRVRFGRVIADDAASRSGGFSPPRTSCTYTRNGRRSPFLSSFLRRDREELRASADNSKKLSGNLKITGPLVRIALFELQEVLRK